MTVIVCTDSRGGMLFAGRRTSRDREILADISRMGEGRRLFCRPYSQKLLSGAGLAPTVCEECLDAAEDGDLVFIEDCPLAPHADRIPRLIRYSFGEAYPYDVALDIDPFCGWRLTERREFAGYSHKLITKEVFEK